MTVLPILSVAQCRACDAWAVFNDLPRCGVCGKVQAGYRKPVELIVDDAGIPTCPLCGGQQFGYMEGCVDYRTPDDAGPGYVRCFSHCDGTADSGDSDPGWFCDNWQGGGCGAPVSIPDGIEERYD